MKLGAQLYSLRHATKTPEDLKATILKCKEMGYENVQFSGVPNMGAEVWAQISKETGMDIVCTHSDFNRIVNDTEAIIAEHKIFSCPVIGIGSMPPEYRGSKENLERFFAIMEEPVKKIEAAGLRFGYHNHAFEFDKFTDAEGCAMDEMIERCPTWCFIADTGWIKYAGQDQIAVLERIGGDRLECIHFKEFQDNVHFVDAICACGEGFSDFESLTAACKRLGVQNVLVEQDNACDKADPFGEMKRSAEHLLPFFAD